MSTFQVIVVAGVALGVVQLAAGLAIGLWLGRRRRPVSGGSLDQERAARLAADLRGLTDSVASSVRRHSAAIESIDQRLRLETDGDASVDVHSPLTNLVVGVVGQMLGANQQMQQELSQAQAELQRQAEELDKHRVDSLTDPLTGLPNRRALDDHLQSRLNAWRTHKAPFSALMLDVDHFKQFNDTHGHQAGDAALVAFGNALASALRKQDVVARYGGEEFAVLLPYATLEEARGAVTKVCEAIAGVEVPVDGMLIPLTASGGLASIEHAETGESLIDRADQALYAAKHAGRDRVFLHTGTSIEPFDSAGSEQLLNKGSSDESLSDELSQACADLRVGLADFMSQP